MKKILNLLLITVLLFLVSCSGKLTPPNDLVVSDNIISFSEVEGAKHKAVLLNKDTNKEYVRVINSGITLDSLSLEPGMYEMYLEVSLGDEVVKTEVVSFVIEDSFAIKDVSGEDMLYSDYIKIIGRSYYDQELGAVMMTQAGSGFTVKFRGTSLKADICATNSLIGWKKPWIAVVIDGDYDNPNIMSIDKKNIDELVLASGLEYGEHEVTLVKRSEALDSFIGVKNVYSDGKLLNRVDKDRFIEILGDSTIAGYGNETQFVGGKYENKTSANSNVMKTFGYLTAQAFDADYSIVCASGWGLTGSEWTTPKTVNLLETYKRYYSTYSETKQQHIYSDELYNFSLGRIADVVIISVGTNDLYYIEAGQNQSQSLGAERKQAFIDAYKELLEFITSIYPGVEIFMVYGAMGETRMYPTVKAAYDNVKDTMSNVHLVRLYGDQKAVDYHPSTKGHEEMSLDLINEIKNVMNW